MITMSTRFGNTGNMKKGSNVLPKSAAWKLKSVSDAVALEAITPKVSRKTFDPERQVPYSEKSSLFDAPHCSLCEGRFGGHDERWSREDDEYPQGGIDSTSVIRPAPPDVHMSGEEAYQRRLAISTNFKTPSQTTPSTSVPIVADAACPAAAGPPAPLPRAETGEEAYLRRVAMSQGPPSSLSKPAPLQPPPSTGEDYERRAAFSSQQMSPPPPQNQREPSEPASDPPGYNPFAPQSAPPPPPIPSTAAADNVNPEFEERVRNSRNAAAAIAARFSALAPPAEDNDLSDPAPEESGPEPSAR